MLALIILWNGRAQSTRSNWKRGDQPRHPCPYNSINDKAAFDRSINKLANGKTPA
jgi:hypothetical protein